MDVGAGHSCPSAYLGVKMSSSEFKWFVRKGNTSRFTTVYQQLDGTPISLTGVTATLFVYDGEDIVMEVDTAPNITIDELNGRIDVFLADFDILGFDFELGEFELNLNFANGDISTIVDGPLIVQKGRGPFE